jgi:hypothetical protein
VPKIEVNVPEAEHAVITEIARKLGLTVETLIQQEVDQALATASVWLQRA